MSYINLISKPNYSIIELKRGRANPINQEMVDELSKTINLLEDDDSVKGIIITGQPDFFSVGLDIIELFEYDEIQIKKFFKDFGRLFIELNSFTKIHISAINGYAPAGGTLLAIPSDYRIMANDKKFKIGLNEVSVGVPPSQRMIDSYSFVLGDAISSKLTLQGSLLSPIEALKFGLVDQLSEKDLVITNAEKKMDEMLKGDFNVYKFAKKKLRSNLLSKLNYNDENELTEILRIWWEPSSRNRIKNLITKLKK